MTKGRGGTPRPPRRQEPVDTPAADSRTQGERYRDDARALLVRSLQELDHGVRLASTEARLARLGDVRVTLAGCTRLIDLALNCLPVALAEREGSRRADTLPGSVSETQAPPPSAPAPATAGPVSPARQVAENDDPGPEGPPTSAR